MSCAVIFGGTGFIGSFFAAQLVATGRFATVYLFDIEPLSGKKSDYRKRMLSALPGVSVIIGDVRKPIEWRPAESVGLIANFAAVHREPGHENYEYYETNLLGAENVCAWAVQVGCRDVIFTSSISPYGPSEHEKDESSLPVPATAYGGSKLAAEKIHMVWQAAKVDDRYLTIVRPGVVFGPGEGGNVSRLIKAVLHGYFFYMGNRNTRKAGTYVKELCLAMLWVLDRQKQSGEHVALFNMSMNPGPSIAEYVKSVCVVSNVNRFVPSVPYIFLLTVSMLIELLAKPLGISHPFSPVRIRKLVNSNNILPRYLERNHYPYTYTLDTAFRDWMQTCPEEWS